MLKFTKELAYEAGVRLKKSRKKLNAKDLSFKSRRDIVTSVDIESERFITRRINKKYPRHQILAEELHGGLKKTSPEHLWIIDPIDGTINYVHDFPFYCVSIAYQKNGETEAGVVYAPVLDEMFYASKGHGAYLNGKRICVSKEKKMMDAMLGTGFPYKMNNPRTNNINHFNRLIKKTRAIRRAGSAALDLCYVAMGRFDGFWEIGLKPWDVAAGDLIITEAGGCVTDFQGRKYQLNSPETAASNRLIHPELIKILSTI